MPRQARRFSPRDGSIERSLDAVISSGIKDHGNTDTIPYFGRYFLDCIQKHIKHHEQTFESATTGLVEVWGLSRLSGSANLAAHSPGALTRRQSNTFSSP